MATPTELSFLTADRVLVRATPTDTNVGSAVQQSSNSASSLLSTLGSATVIALIFFVAFLILRPWFPRFYTPRAFLSSLRRQEHSPTLPKGFLNWIPEFFKISDTVVLNTQTLDGFLFLRLLKIGVIICLVGMAVTWPILIPINATGSGGLRQLNILTFGNVASPEHPMDYWRFYAHAFVAWIFFSFCIWMITRESLYYINLRQAYLVSPLYSDRVSSRTVLFSAVPGKYLDKEVILELMGPDVVRNIWIPRDTKELTEKVEERDKIALKLETAETKLIVNANKARSKYLKKHGNESADLARRDSVHNQSRERGSIAARWLKPEQRPTHRLKFLVGKKVDTIDWCRDELSKIQPEVEKMQQEFRDGKGRLLNSVFVEFNTIRDAQSAYQSLTHHQPLHMAPRYAGIFPEEIIWSNLRIRWYELIVRKLVTYAAVIAVVIFWSIPVAFVGAVSQLSYLVSLPEFHWLAWLKDLGVVTGVITGLLPAVMLSVLMAVLPVFLRIAATQGGEPTLSGVEYTVQNTYFWFYIVQGFLVTTLSSGAATAFANIVKDPQSVVSLLANSLPAASNFYLSYITLQGLVVVSQTLVSVVGLGIFIILGRFLDSTPRKLYNRWSNLSNPGMGTLFPIYTTMLIIGITYSCIAPLVQGFAALGLYLFYLAYRYEFLYVYHVPFDTKGLMYPRALQQLFAGLYLAELCMIGLLALQLGNNGKAVLGPFIMMIALLIFTLIYHFELNIALSPLLKYLPKTLETEERRLLASESDDEEEGIESERPTGTAPVESSPSSFEKPLPSLPKFNLPRSGTDVLKGGTEVLKGGKGLVEGGGKKFSQIFLEWLRPDKYQDYYTLRKLVPRNFASISYDEQVESDAYYHPSITAKPPVLWIPNDPAGVSKQEIRETDGIIPMSDRSALLNEKNKIVWSKDQMSAAPIYEERVYY